MLYWINKQLEQYSGRILREEGNNSGNGGVGCIQWKFLQEYSLDFWEKGEKIFECKNALPIGMRVYSFLYTV